MDSSRRDARRSGLLRRPTPKARGALVAAMAALASVAAVTIPGAGPGVPAATAATASVASASSFGADFAQPAASFRPKTRVWWTCGDISAEEVRSQMQSVKDAGFSGVEIICFSTGRPAEFGWGSATLNQRMQEALDAGERLGLTIDWTVSGSWPLNVPGVGPNDAAAAKELVQGRAVVPGGQAFSGAVPEPTDAPGSGVTQKTLIAVQAARCATDCTGASVALAPGSLVDLTDRVSGNTLDWTAPDDGTWVLISSWQRGTGQQSVVYGYNNVTPGVVTDHFSRAGADAGVDYWNEHVLTPAMRASLKAAGGDIFEDSLELNSRFHWTPELLDEFQKRRGYDLRPYLPILVIPGIHAQYSSVKVTAPARYTLDPAEDARVRRDYYDTLTELYRENHIAPLRAFANGLGLGYRAQPYGTTTDFSALSLDVDVPESEGLATSPTESPLDPLPSYRAQSASVSLTDKGVFSSECCAVANHAYAEPWEDQISRFNGAFVGGVNQIVLHGVAQQYANGQRWPGWSPFTSQGGNGFSEAGGPRMPSWGDVPKITDWMSRMQYAMRSGRRKVDVAVFRDAVGAASPQAGGLEEAGYTYEYVSPAHLRLDTAEVRDGVLAPATAGYRGLVLSDQRTLSLDSARRIRRYAAAGLPVVIAGDLPTTTPGRDGQDDALRAIVADITAQPTVVRVASPDGVAAALDGLGAEPAAEPASASGLVTAHRAVSGGDVYVAFNPTRSTITRTFTLEGSGRPAVFDAWTGEVRPVAAYREVAGGVQVRVSLRAGESVLYGVGGFTAALPAHVDELLAGVTATESGELFVDGDGPGTYTAKLSDGHEATADIARVGAPVDLQDWSLSVEDWHRNAALDLEKATSTHELAGGLKPWSQIPGLEDSSGIGVYRTTFDLPQTWTGGRTAVLDLGEVTDTFEVTINGRPVHGVDQTLARVDATDYLQRGENTVEVRVATMLRNRLRVTPGFPAQATQARQDYGLIGPVVLKPYGRAQLRTAAGPAPTPPVDGPAPVPGTIAATAVPRITGTPRVGRILKASAGRWNAGGLSFRYQWLRNGRTISGQTRSTLRLGRTEVGRRISVRVTATAGGRSGVATSKRTGVVRKATAAVRITARTPVTKGRTVRVRLRVIAAGTKPAGRVALTVGGRRVRTVSVADGRTRTVTVPLPKRGVSTLRATFAGSDTVGRATSARLEVRRR